jgi:peptide subunit release factor 1 (eRF1)
MGGPDESTSRFAQIMSSPARERLAGRFEAEVDPEAAGAPDVLAMLEQARVETLLYSEEFDAPDPVVLEKAIEDAIAQSAEVLPVRHHVDELREHADIAAVLRF